MSLDMRELLQKVKGGYILVFVTYLLMSRIVMFVNIIGFRINSIIFSLFAIIGTVLLVFEILLNYKNYLKIEYILLLLFVIFTGVSSLLNYKYGFSANLKTLVWTSIHFFLVFSYFRNHEDERGILNNIMKSSCVIFFIAVIISLVQFFLLIAYVAPFTEYDRRQGFVEGRLFGIFTDPNIAAVTSIIIIIFSICLYRKTARRWEKRFYIVNMVVQGLYVALSGSRTALVVVGAIAGIYTFFFMLEKWKQKTISYKIVKIIGCTLAAMVISVCVISCCETILKNSIKQVKVFRNYIIGTEDEELVLEREDLEGDISNNRFSIWSSAIYISKDNRLFGVSPRNLLPFARANYPDSYTSITGYETHNGYLAVFVCGGVSSSIVIICLILLFIKNFLLSCRKNNGMREENVYRLCIIVSIAITCFFYPDIFYCNSFSAVLFWLMLGWAFREFQLNVKENEESYKKGK